MLVVRCLHIHSSTLLPPPTYSIPTDLPPPCYQVRCLHIHSNTLFSGASDCKVKLWDLKTNDCTTLFGHTSFVRAIACDEAGQTLYSGADDRKIKIWQAR